MKSQAHIVSAGPTSSGPDFLGPFIGIDLPAFYTNFGSSAIDVAAPGGNLSFDLWGNIAGYGLVWGACASRDREFDFKGNLESGLRLRTRRMIRAAQELIHFTAAAGSTSRAPWDSRKKRTLFSS
jgi:hypothetical protein